MVKVKKHKILLEKTKNEFENMAVLNPGTIKVDNNVHMFYRAVKQGNYSSIGYAKLEGPLKVVERAEKPVIEPEHEYETHGTEDPRIIFMNGLYYLFYMAYDGKNVLTAYATSKDMKTWKKQKPISHLISYAEAEKIFIKAGMNEKYFNYDLYDKTEKDSAETVYIWGKDSFIFPKKIKGKYALLHRILPNIHVIYFNKFEELTKDYWLKYLTKLKKHTVLDTKYWYESRAIGAGAPPVETDKGWLLIYHGIENSPKGKIYRASAALLDKNDPFKVIGRLNKPLFSPEEKWEKTGNVNNVVFPTGTALFNDELYIYYGAADKRIAVASVKLDTLLAELGG